MDYSKKYDFKNFVHDMTVLVERSQDDNECVVEAERLVGKLIQSHLWLPAEKRRPSKEGYSRHPLYCDPEDRFEVIALVWMPGQKTTLHDHDDTWGAEGVVVGQVKVTNYVRLEELSGGNIVKLQHTDSIVVKEQKTGKLLPPADCHILEGVGDKPAITIHVYGKQLRKFRIFTPLDEEGLYLAEEKHVEYSPA
ncbi:cysteine dioxygenase family protein [Peribacillus frigoritolerans]|uniref:cysteine dioxygenase family protein n=1 Tax=Peribacillus frigoritolerans TaxID=450367 RepID=UPI0025A109C7|nr:cysteine dioxygenase family protein [Peribacillus frigoritolerans]MDM5309422.1 cysteine dioxygenase family protein [Peribacillus frigoritolerans]